MDVILHLGVHRCGTTTFQQLLQRNTAMLRDAGLESWTPDRTRAGLMAGLIQRPEDLTPQIEARALRSSGIVQIEVERLAKAGRRKLLISEENLTGAVRNNLRESLLYPKLNVRLSRLGPALSQHVTTIGLSIRSYDAFWASSIAFGVAQGHAVPGLGKLDYLVAQPRRWRDVVGDIADAFPKAQIVVWPFERLGSQPDAQLAVLSGGIRLTHALNGCRDWHNPSPRLDKLRRILTMRGEVEAAARLPEGDGRWNPFSEDQRTALRKQYHEDLAWFQSGADGLARFVERVDDGVVEAIVAAARQTARNHDVSGFAAGPQPWVPPEGGQHNGKHSVMV
jgi:hypothetical protein